MTPLTEIADRLRAAGVVIRAEGGHLRFRARAGSYTPSLRALVREHEAELVAMLSESLPQRDLAYWRAAYGSLESWPAELQQVWLDRAATLESGGLGRDDCEAQAFEELRDAAQRPAPSVALRDRLGVTLSVFGAVCQQTIRRPAPSTIAEDARVCGALLARFAAEGGAP